METKRRKKRGKLVDLLTVVEQDKSTVFGIDPVAKSIISCLADKLSPKLMEDLKSWMRGFSEEAQLEIADDLLGFACGHVIHITGIKVVDRVLYSFYWAIAEEQGYDPRDVYNAIYE